VTKLWKGLPEFESSLWLGCCLHWQLKVSSRNLTPFYSISICGFFVRVRSGWYCKLTTHVPTCSSKGTKLWCRAFCQLAFVKWCLLSVGLCEVVPSVSWPLWSGAFCQLAFVKWCLLSVGLCEVVPSVSWTLWSGAFCQLAFVKWCLLSVGLCEVVPSVSWPLWSGAKLSTRKNIPNLSA